MLSPGNVESLLGQEATKNKRIDRVITHAVYSSSKKMPSKGLEYGIEDRLVPRLGKMYLNVVVKLRCLKLCRLFFGILRNNRLGPMHRFSRRCRVHLRLLLDRALFRIWAP